MDKWIIRSTVVHKRIKNICLTNLHYPIKNAENLLTLTIYSAIIKLCKHINYYLRNKDNLSEYVRFTILVA